MNEYARGSPRDARPSVVDEYCHHLDALEKELGELASRLDPILIPEGPRSNEIKDQLHVSTGSVLRTHASRLGRLVELLHEIRKRIDL